MSNEVYINRISKFLPNEPVLNEEMEHFLGRVQQTPSKSKNIVLRNNGIKTRYYALDKSGNTTHTNAEMVSIAIQNLFTDNPEEVKKIELLSCGTSTPDQLIPSHAAMVHGSLKNSSPMEVVSHSGVCCSGMHAFKYAWMSIKTGLTNNAIASGSERVSSSLRSEVFEEEVNKLMEAHKNPFVSFEKDFLRWMLSDGAGAFFLENKARKDGNSLRIDWLEGVSYAHIVEPCMYSGCIKLPDGSLKGFMDFDYHQMAEKSVLSIKQDVKLLSEKIVVLGIDKLKSTLNKYKLSIDEIDYFLPHISSEFFRSKMAQEFDKNNLHIPPEKWFTNLSSVGNIGSGSIYLILEELFNQHPIQKGQKILLAVPESARFSYMYGLLTVV
ncbi:MAG: beta-ketoacyl-ACP synthase III [Flavobacteriales bacterium]|nr:beta-ketoacyl-ACP synthase III [Flavobacteriales bacterium]